jgi:hypothetical protein
MLIIKVNAYPQEFSLDNRQDIQIDFAERLGLQTCIGAIRKPFSQRKEGLFPAEIHGIGVN